MYFAYSTPLNLDSIQKRKKFKKKIIQKEMVFSLRGNPIKYILQTSILLCFHFKKNNIYNDCILHSKI